MSAYGEGRWRPFIVDVMCLGIESGPVYFFGMHRWIDAVHGWMTCMDGWHAWVDGWHAWMDGYEIKHGKTWKSMEKHGKQWKSKGKHEKGLKSNGKAWGGRHFPNQ